MGRLARKRKHKGDRPMKEKYRLKRKTKDVDEIHEDLKPDNAEKLLNQAVDFDQPGQAQHYCLTCAKHFIDEAALKSHFKGSPHKRRLKQLKEEPYTVAEAERAAGMGSYIAPAKLNIQTQPVKETMDQTVETDT